MAEKQDLNLVVTEERMEDLDLETFYNLDSNSPKAMVDFVAHFVHEDGDYVDRDEAAKRVITGRKVGDIKEIMENLRNSMENSAVPKA